MAAGAFIGLGLTALGIGTRYSAERAFEDGKPVLARLSSLDGPLVFILVLLTCAALVGVGVAFLGLSYHHFRREREHQWERERAASRERTTV